MKELADRDITVAGAELAARAIKAGLVDEYHLIVSPIVGGFRRDKPYRARAFFRIWRLQLRNGNC